MLLWAAASMFGHHSEDRDCPRNELLVSFYGCVSLSKFILHHYSVNCVQFEINNFTAFSHAAPWIIRASRKWDKALTEHLNLMRLRKRRVKVNSWVKHIFLMLRASKRRLHEWLKLSRCKDAWRSFREKSFDAFSAVARIFIIFTGNWTQITPSRRCTRLSLFSSIFFPIHWFIRFLSLLRLASSVPYSRKFWFHFT